MRMEVMTQALIMTMEDFGNILIRQVNDLKGFVINPYGREHQHFQTASVIHYCSSTKPKMREKMGN